MHRVESIPNHVSRLPRDPCSAPRSDRYVDVRYARGFFGVFFLRVLFKVCQGLRRGERVSSPLNPEPLVSHHITNLLPPAVCADPATKRLLPRLLHRALQALLCADSHQTSDCTELPAPLAPASAQPRGCWSTMPAHADCHGLFVLRAAPHESLAF